MHLELAQLPESEFRAQAGPIKVNPPYDRRPAPLPTSFSSIFWVRFLEPSQVSFHDLGSTPKGHTTNASLSKVPSFFYI